MSKKKRFNSEDQFDLPLGEKLRDEGIKRVSDHNVEWVNLILFIIYGVANRFETFTSDEVRNAARLHGIPEPQSPNAWGAAFQAAHSQKLIAKVEGSMRSSKLPSSHARMLQVWKMR